MYCGAAPHIQVPAIASPGRIGQGDGQRKGDSARGCVHLLDIKQDGRAYLEGQHAALDGERHGGRTWPISTSSRCSRPNEGGGHQSGEEEQTGKQHVTFLCHHRDLSFCGWFLPNGTAQSLSHRHPLHEEVYRTKRGIDVEIGCHSGCLSARLVNVFQPDRMGRWRGG